MEDEDKNVALILIKLSGVCYSNKKQSFTRSPPVRQTYLLVMLNHLKFLLTTTTVPLEILLTKPMGNGLSLPADEKLRNISEQHINSKVLL